MELSFVSYSVEELCQDFEDLLSEERQSSYSHEELDLLYDAAIAIRKKVDQANMWGQIPYELTRFLGNIDFGAIKHEYRTWIIEDAEETVRRIRRDGLPPKK